MSPDIGFVRPAYLEKVHHGHIEHEYLRRVAKQIRRIIGDECVFFGEGLHPLFRSRLPMHRYVQDVFDNYLWAYGVDAPPQFGLLRELRQEHKADLFFLRSEKSETKSD